MPPAQRWEFYEDWGYSPKEFMQHFAEGINGGVIFMHGTPMDDCHDHISQLRKSGHSIHIVTNRSVPGAVDQGHANTRKWLQKHNIEYDSLGFSSDKTTVLPVDVFFEDSPRNAKALLDAGCPRVALYDQAWNKHHHDPRWNRVKSWDEFMVWVGDIQKEVHTTNQAAGLV
jgi:uncharacterized HAD superfamily protein